MKPENMSEIMNVLKSIDIFSTLDEQEYPFVFSFMKQRDYIAGETLFREGDSGDELFVVVKGQIGISLIMNDGKELQISCVGPGGFFGEMSLIEHAPRSATCKALEATTLFSLHANNFNTIIKSKPGIAARIMLKMLAITTERLMSTSSFLSQMVQWGESARQRAVTDEATGLFNRRFLDDSINGIFERSVLEKKPLSIAMMDLDHFGELNKTYGISFGDRAISEMVDILKTMFGKDDILVRYGGDEFTVILPSSDALKTLEICINVCKVVHALKFPEHHNLSISLSIGIASFPDNAASIDELFKAADRALYRAKELGRNRAVIAQPPGPFVGCSPGEIKTAPRSIAERNRIINNIIAAMMDHDGFMLIGHRNLDDDCFASMVAFGLLLRKLNKSVYLVTGGENHEQFEYLISICKYNGIQLGKDGTDLSVSTNVLIAFDTPKPSMLEDLFNIQSMKKNQAILKIELDHHLESDTTCFGDIGYNFVIEASSTSELAGIIAMKLSSKIMNLSIGVEELFSRNFVLSVMTGMLAESRMGKYLKGRLERKRYEWFVNRFDRMLKQKTHIDSGNMTSKEDVYKAIVSLSADEIDCYDAIYKKRSGSGKIKYIILDDDESSHLRTRYGADVFSDMTKAATDALAEESGFLGMIVYPDDPGISDYVQFRLRRSQYFKLLDLRDVLSRLNFTNGGGHPGAIGFRFHRTGVLNIRTFALDVSERIEKLLKEIKNHNKD